MPAVVERGYPEVFDPERKQSSFFVRDLSSVLHRRYAIILACTLVGSVIGGVVLRSLPPSYSSESTIVFDARRPRVTDLPSLVAEQTTNPEAAQLRSEVEVLQSQSLASRVIDQLSLLKVPEFQPHASLLAGEGTKVTRAFFDWFPNAAARLPFLKARPMPTAANSARLALAYALQVYREHLAVSNDAGSYVIRIRFTSDDPKLSAAIVNAHVQLYLADQVQYKQEVGKEATTWLTGELANLEAKLRTSEEAEQRFRESNLLVQSGGTTLLSEQLKAVNAQIPIADEDLANKEARLGHAQELLHHDAVDSQSDVLESPVIQRMREDEATLTRRLAELEAVDGEQNPAVVQTRAEVRDIKDEIGRSVARVVKGLENDVDVARRKQADLRDRLAELEKRSVIADRAEGNLSDLKREVSANSSLIEVLLTRYKQVSAQEQIQQPDARVVSVALPAVSPSFPRMRVHLPLVFAASLMLGTALAFTLEMTRQGFKGVREVETECDLPSLGSVPAVPRRWRRLAAPHDLVIDHPGSRFAEAIGYVRNSIQAHSVAAHTPIKTLLVTSCLPHEGKSVFAVSLARSFTHLGLRTLLIDCDVRNPSVRRLVNAASGGACLSRVLDRETHWKDAVVRDAISPLEVLGAESPVSAPHTLIASAAMCALIDFCRSQYDVVVLDTPPITAVSDALTLSRWVDATVLTVRWGVTPREIAKTSLNKLFQSGAQLCGAVLTQVDMRRGIFSRAEIEYYHKKNKRYYAH
jgi:capsular exopolysaccharide synthesis family protein